MIYCWGHLYYDAFHSVSFFGPIFARLNGLYNVEGNLLREDFINDIIVATIS